jgi:hypothetical protein
MGPFLFSCKIFFFSWINIHFLHIDLTEWVCENPRRMCSSLLVKKTSD